MQTAQNQLNLPVEKEPLCFCISWEAQTLTLRGRYKKSGQSHFNVIPQLDICHDPNNLLYFTCCFCRLGQVLQAFWNWGHRGLKHLWARSRVMGEAGRGKEGPASLARRWEPWAKPGCPQPINWDCSIDLANHAAIELKLASPIFTVNKGIPSSVIVGETFIADLIPPFRIFSSEFWRYWNANCLRATPHFLGASCILYLERNAPAAFNHTSIIAANSSTPELESPWNSRFDSWWKPHRHENRRRWTHCGPHLVSGGKVHLQNKHKNILSFLSHRWSKVAEQKCNFLWNHLQVVDVISQNKFLPELGFHSFWVE